MKRFSIISSVVVVSLAMVAGGLTYGLQEISTTLEVVSATADFIHLRANSPVQSATLADETYTIDTVGADLYIRPSAPFAPSEKVKLAFDSIKNRFGNNTKDMQISVPVPPETFFFITPSGVLGSYDLQAKTTQFHTPEGFVVNEYAVSDGGIFILGFEQTPAHAQAQDGSIIQSLYQLEPVTERLQLILPTKKWNMHRLMLSPDGQLLGLYRATKKSYAPPTLWLYDTAEDAWIEYWNDDFGAGAPISFSPDNAWLLGIDIETQGYALSPTQEGTDSKPIGNLFEAIGMSPNGQFIGFKTYADGDFFSGESAITLFDQTGESRSTLTEIDTMLTIFDPTDDGVLWFTYADENDVRQIGKYEYATDSWGAVTAFEVDQEILSLWKAPHSEVLIYGTKARRAVSGYDPDAGIGSLVDTYFDAENAPLFSLVRYDIATKTAEEIAEGMSFGAS